MLSPIKLILLLAIIGVVYAIARKAGFLSGKTKDGGKLDKKGDLGSKESTELLKCPECGTFVASLEDHHCNH